jgi:uncharacterized protein YajQ (UPF0234 family)
MESVVTIWGDSEFQLKQVADILYQKLTKRGIDIRAVDPGKVEVVGGRQAQAGAHAQAGHRSGAGEKDREAHQGIRPQSAGRDPG